ncbi:hypothetical protein EC957_001998 [Mortierella hygrophila]|uniref:Mixed lineage kinase domain-containing protein n=1 Tax=Mortierella hygrophila TaxID=979708 RepID=A0A9P6FF90_9FUNG|nr:hypothetical protein EC957_001998 [Mortierella hygrophila]
MTQQTTKPDVDGEKKSAPKKITASGIAEKAFVAGSNIVGAKEAADTGYNNVVKIVGGQDSPVLSNMIHLADKLVDVGKIVPFIAPAFMILKIIIDIEQKAREVDEKCSDLMERINFLVSHLVVLERIHNVEAMMDTLTTVLQKVQDTLKEAAALIEAYRKQSKIARRLRMSNMQTFEQMAGKITTCSSDLMMSLQIQQTGDLSILKRVVPRDRIAENFIRENGGQDMINNDPELVKKFAEKVNLTMSDQVMEQMQSNMQELITRNQSRIEAIVHESSSINVADMIKAIATHQRELEAELKLTCVQCEKEYHVSTNGPESCRFHSAVGNYNRYHCCQKTSPCQKGYHQPEHHSRYPYSSFFLWSYGILAPKDTVVYWVNIKEIDLDKDDDTTGQVVRVGQLIRWRSWGELVTAPLMLVNVGHVRDDIPYYLEVFDVASLEDTRKRTLRTGRTCIFRNAPETETAAFSMGEWVLDEETQQIAGIKLTVRVASSKTPTVCIIPLDPLMLKMPDEASVKYLSRCSGAAYKPDRPYDFPKTIQLGPVIPASRIREPRSFRTRISSPNIPLLLTPAWEMVANNDVKVANNQEDRFRGTWRALNRSPLSSQKQIILLSAKFEYRLVGEPVYKPVKSFALRNGVSLPITIAPSQAIDIPWEFLVDKPEHCQGDSLLAINYAHLTIHQPLRLRVTFTDIEGEEVSLIQEYVHGVKGATLPEPEDLGFFFVDNIYQCQRTSVKISESPSPDRYLLGISAGSMPTNKITEVDLRRIVAKAEKTGITEVDMKLGVRNLGIDWTIWALVDLSCRRVYGFKVLLYHGSMTKDRISASMGYAPCPIYGGDDLESRPIQYAEESKIVPNVAHWDDDVVVIEDDDVDNDVVIPISASSPLPVASVTPIPAPVSVPISEPISLESLMAKPATTETADPGPESPQPPLIGPDGSTDIIPSAAPRMVTSAETPVVVKVIDKRTTVRTERVEIPLLSLFPPVKLPPPPPMPTFHLDPVISATPSALSTPVQTTSTPSTASSPAHSTSSVISATPVSALSMEMLLAKVTALEARLEASERRDALLTKILELEKKLEGTTATVSSRADPAAASTLSAGPFQSERVSALETHIVSIDQKLDRLAGSLDKIATLLSS